MSDMENSEAIEIIEDAANAIGGEVTYSYSGRGMFGRTCVGIECDSSQEVIEEAASRGLRGAAVDNLGLGWIVYWPSVQGWDK